MRTLTTAAIDRLKPPAQGQRDYFDKGYPGLALRCSYGGARSFIHIYRLPWQAAAHDTRPLSGDDAGGGARSLAQGPRGPDRGDDPAGAAIAPDIFAAVAERMAQARPGRATERSPTCARIIAREALPPWGGRLVATITRRDVSRVIASVVDRGHLTMARRLRAHLHRLFRWSVGEGIIERSPMTDLAKPGKAVRRDRVLGDAELAAVWKASAAIGEAEGSGIAGRMAVRSDLPAAHSHRRPPRRDRRPALVGNRRR